MERANLKPFFAFWSITPNKDVLADQREGMDSAAESLDRMLLVEGRNHIKRIAAAALPHRISISFDSALPCEKFPDKAACFFYLFLRGMNIKRQRQDLLLCFFTIGQVTRLVAEKGKRRLQMDGKRVIDTRIDSIAGKMIAELITLCQSDRVVGKAPGYIGQLRWQRDLL